MNPDDDWSALASAWRAQPIDLESLQRASLRRARRMWLMMALDIACALLAVALAARLYLSGADFWTRIGIGIGIGIAALSASVLVNYRLRRGLWHAANDSVAALLKLQRERRLNAIRMVLWGPLFLPLGLLSGLLIGRGATPVSLGWPLWLRLALAAALIVALCVGSVLYVRRQRRQIAVIDAHLAQMAESD